MYAPAIKVNPLSQQNSTLPMTRNNLTCIPRSHDQPPLMVSQSSKIITCVHAYMYFAEFHFPFHPTAIDNSEPNSTFPVLSEYLQMKTVEEYGDGELLGFNAVATKLLGVVTAPIQNALVNKQLQVYDGWV